MYIDLHAAQRPSFAVRIHPQRDRGAGAQRRAEDFEWRGPGVLAAERGSFVGIELMMAGGDRDRVIGRPDYCLCMRHASLQRWVAPIGLSLTFIARLVRPVCNLQRSR